jgi:ABC-type Fe3+ transport system substrate-binding protein
MRAARYWERAVECLRLADASGREDLKAEYRRLAEHYATLAEGEQKIAAYLKRIAANGRGTKTHARAAMSPGSRRVTETSRGRADL